MYIDAYLDKEQERIHVVERIDGKRQYKQYPVEYVFYYDDIKGKHKTIHDRPVSRFYSKNKKEFNRELKINSRNQIYESDINPIFRCLANNYLDADSPILNICYVDIEADFDPEKGFSQPEDPTASVTAITVYLSQLQQLITLALKPKTMHEDIAQSVAKHFENTFVYNSEAQLLQTFLDLIDNSDIITGWNSEGYDLPYLVNRVTRVLSRDDTRRFCLWDQHPKKFSYEKYGGEQTSFKLTGRVHLDYLELYRKYTYHEMHSYSLDTVADYELQDKKIPYEGTLDQLYNTDFEKFIEYNRQDVMLIVRMDEKLRFIDLANELAHQNTVLLPTTMGAVAVTEQAIINEAHAQGLIVPNKPDRDDSKTVTAAGAYVATPKKGLHHWIGSVDINSLYPSAIRALNMGPETIVGQLRPTMTQNHINSVIASGKTQSDGWEGQFGSLEYEAVMNRESSTEITIDWEDGKEEVKTAIEIHGMVFGKHGNKLLLSANGTLFRNDRKGIIPGLLEKWYAERKIMQTKLHEAKTPQDIVFWDKRQLVKKINLNSLYGALLNPYCRFFDIRLGQSTTLCGRTITKHMASYINKIITGEYQHDGDSIIYGDTDSCYFSTYDILKEDIKKGNIPWDKEAVIELYDNVAEEVNKSFPAFMAQSFNCTMDLGEIIKCGREIVASSGLFITKKRYATLIYDLEGKRVDQDGPGKVKAMGMDLKRSDTPVIMQDFLNILLLDVLTNVKEAEIIEKIKAFKFDFADKPGWEKGTPKRVNNLTMYTKREEREGKANMPGHVRAAMNWNNLRNMNSDKYSMQIMDGQKTIVCKLKNNPMGITSVAYPIDEGRLPDWFKELPFDHIAMEETIIDKKIGNLLNVMKWDLRQDTSRSTFDDLFEL
jgi:DNA polymerase elongation subunit (family B)